MLGIKLGLPEFRTKLLYIDDSSMDDDKILPLLTVLRDQDCLESIILMNCTIKNRDTAMMLGSLLSESFNANKQK